MSNTDIKLKKSSVVGKAPTTGDLDYGEVAINYADGRLYYKDASNVIKNFVDSDLVESSITNLIDSDYIQFYQLKDAASISFDNTETGYVATNVQSAIDELFDKKLDVTAVGSNVTYYPTNASADVASYFRVVTATSDSDYNTAAVDIPTGVIDSDDIFIAALVSDAGTLIGETGTINITTVGNVRRSTGIGGASFYYEIYKRDSAGAETLLTTSSNTFEVTETSYEEFFAAALLPNTTFTANDRVVFKYYGTRTTGFGTPEFDFQFGGTQPVRSLFPVPVTVVPHANDAEDIIVSTSNFAGILSGADDNVQAALDTIDDITTTDLPEGSNLYYTKVRVDSDITNLIDSAYINLRVDTGTDSAQVVTIINDTVDATFINALTIDADTLGGQAGSYYLDYTNFTNTPNVLDSADVTNLIDSAYINARVDAVAGTDSAQVISIITNTVDQTFVNNLNVDADTLDNQDGTYYLDYTNFTNTPNVLDSASVLATVTADGFTKFDSGNASGLITTAINNLIDAAPAALDTLNELAAALGDDANFSTTVTNAIAALPDSAEVVTLINSTVDASFINALTIDADTLGGQAGSYYLDYTNFTNTPNILDSANVTDLIDSAYINFRVDAVAGGLDSAAVISLIDSDYVKLRDTVQETSTTLSTTSQTSIGAWPTATYGGGKYLIQATSSGERHATELLITHNGTTAVATEYASVWTNTPLATYDVDISGSDFRILATGASATSTTYKILELHLI